MEVSTCGTIERGFDCLGRNADAGILTEKRSGSRGRRAITFDIDDNFARG